METHRCNKESEISEIHAIVKRLDDALRGNGKPGLFTQFAVMKATMGGLIGLNFLFLIGLITMWVKM